MIDKSVMKVKYLYIPLLYQTICLIILCDLKKLPFFYKYDFHIIFFYLFLVYLSQYQFCGSNNILLWYFYFYISRDTVKINFILDNNCFCDHLSNNLSNPAIFYHIKIKLLTIMLCITDTFWKFVVKYIVNANFSTILFSIRPFSCSSNMLHSSGFLIFISRIFTYNWWVDCCNLLFHVNIRNLFLCIFINLRLNWDSTIPEECKNSVKEEKNIKDLNATNLRYIWFYFVCFYLIIF